MSPLRIALSSLIALAPLAACGDGGPSGPDPALDLPVDPATGLRLPELPPVPPLPEWPENPPSAAKAELGRALFWDPRLSGSGAGVCSNCHLASTHFQSSTPLDAPDRVYPAISPPLHRHTPSLYNIVYAPMLRWDGSHFTDLADAMVLPFAEANMNLAGRPASDGEYVDIPGAQAALHEKLTVEAPGYVAAFQEAFGEDITTATPERVWRLAGLALAVFVRVAVSRDAAFDRWNAGEDDAISDAAKRGAILFTGKARCIACHRGPLLSDFAFHNVSTSPPDASGARHDEGRFLVTGDEADRGAFLTPMLRSAGRTSPYLHDGSMVGLREVIRLKSGPAGRVDPLHDATLDGIPALTDAELDDLVEFVKSLDGAPLPITAVAPPATLP